jgi:hypothetical protein
MLPEAWVRLLAEPTAWWMGAAGGAAGFWVPAPVNRATAAAGGRCGERQWRGG